MVDYLQQELKNVIDPTQIYLYGQSLGGAVAFHVAQEWEKSSRKPLAGVIVENTFCSIDDMVDVVFPILSPVKPLVLRMHWNSKDILSRGLDVPILFLAGQADEIVPHAQMLELYRISQSKENSNSVLEVIPNGRHNDTWMQGGQRYWDAVAKFLKEKEYN